MPRLDTWQLWPRKSLRDLLIKPPNFQHFKSQSILGLTYSRTNDWAIIKEPLELSVENENAAAIPPIMTTDA